VSARNKLNISLHSYFVLFQLTPTDLKSGFSHFSFRSRQIWSELL